MIVVYKEHKVGKHRMNFIIDSKIILESKAVSELTDVFRQTTLSYLKATSLKLGLRINFGEPRLRHERIVN
jgi:GxxExxY protein